MKLIKLIASAATIAKNERREFLAYLLEMALIEAAGLGEDKPLEGGQCKNRHDKKR